MGCCASAPAPADYLGELLADRTLGPFSVKLDTEDGKAIPATKERNAKGEEVEIPGRSAVYRHPKTAKGNLVNALPDGPNTVWAIFERGSNKFPDNNCLGKIVPAPKDSNEEDKIEWYKFKDVKADVLAVGAGLLDLGANHGDAIGIISGNRCEWTITALGIYSQSMVTVALYDTLGENAVDFILRDAGVKIALTSVQKIEQLLQVKEAANKEEKQADNDQPELQLHTIVVYDSENKYALPRDKLKPEIKERAEKAGLKLVTFTRLIELGTQVGKFDHKPAADELALLMYTSGTTGNPKGVRLLHSNIAAAIGSGYEMTNMTDKDRHISYLPLAHIFETVVQAVMWYSGGGIGFARGDMRKIGDDFKLVKPTALCGVPRVFSKVKDKAYMTINSLNCIKKAVVMNAIAAQTEHVRKGDLRNAKWDQKVFAMMRERMGFDEVRLIVTGAAPMPPNIAEFLKVVIGAPVIQGYGMTETCAAGTISAQEDYLLGHCGGPLSCVEVRLEDVPEMGYRHTDMTDGVNTPRGEVLFRGPNIFDGYHNNAKATKETIEESGWMHTGDVGRINPNGSLSIIDRKKSMFKLMNGEYVAAESIEAALKLDFLNQIWIYGNSYHNFLLAVGVPYPETVVPFLESKGLWPSDSPKVAPSKEFLDAFEAAVTKHYDLLHDEILKQLTDKAKSEKVMGPSEVFLYAKLNGMFEGFNTDNDLMTPTAKLRRPQLLKFFKDNLKPLYGKLGEPVKADEVW